MADQVLPSAIIDSGRPRIGMTMKTHRPIVAEPPSWFHRQENRWEAASPRGRRSASSRRGPLASVRKLDGLSESLH
jgi:hypothetical protein